VRLLFKQWLENAGVVYSNVNNRNYTSRCVGSNIVAVDKENCDSLVNVEKIFGKRKKRHKKEKP